MTIEEYNRLTSTDYFVCVWKSPCGLDLERITVLTRDEALAALAAKIEANEPVQIGRHCYGCFQTVAQFKPITDTSNVHNFNHI